MLALSLSDFKDVVNSGASNVSPRSHYLSQTSPRTLFREGKSIQHVLYLPQWWLPKYL